MKCDTAFKQVRILRGSDDEKVEPIKGRGRGFKDEREYLAFIMEQERAWEHEHLWCDVNEKDDEKE